MQQQLVERRREIRVGSDEGVPRQLALGADHVRRDQLMGRGEARAHVGWRVLDLGRLRWHAAGPDASFALGMAGQAPLELDLSPLGPETLVYDIVYAPLVTPLLVAAEARDLVTIDGLDMLVGQAAVAFELFFGVAPPRDADDELRGILLA